MASVVTSDLHDQIRGALIHAASGLTARQLMNACDVAEDLNEVVREVNALKGHAKVVADGMRDSQVVYKIGRWPANENSPEAPQPASNIHEIIPSKPPRRSASGLREDLFEVMEMLKAKKIDVSAAKTYAALAMTILKSVEVQIDLERLQRDSKGRTELGDIPLVPALEAKR